MAEEGEKGEKKGINVIFPVKNFFKMIGREVFRMPWRYTRPPGYDIRVIPTSKKLDKMINFSTIAQLNRALVEVERKWDGIPSLGKDHPDYPKNTGDNRKLVAGLYSKKGEKGPDGINVTNSIGPFTDKDALITEARYAQYGTGIRNDETIDINIKGERLTFNFSVPKLKPVIIYDSMYGERKYEVAFFGCQSDSYWTQLKKEVEHICKVVLEKTLEGETDEVKQANARKNVNEVIKHQIDLLIGYIQKYEIAFEEKHRSMLIGGEGVLQNHNIIDKIRSEVMNLRLTADQVHYTHTYKIIKPKIVDKDGNIRRLEDVDPGFKRPEEQGYGLDENGWPLEVGDGETPFGNRILEKGEVLIDIYMNDENERKRKEYEQEGKPFPEWRKEVRKIRRVPEEFIQDCSLLDVAAWIYVHYDSYRDDLRDARYHKNAITVMERIMTELKTKGHPQRMRDIKKGKHAEVTMKLNNVPNRPKEVKMPITTTHILPAFDLRAKGKTKHIGKKYYYELQENIYRGQSLEPTIGTRGAALYILHKVIDEVKYWGGTGEPGKEGVVELLQAIGEITDGYDIGPNMGPEFVGWGKPLTRNPFRPLDRG